MTELTDRQREQLVDIAVGRLEGQCTLSSEQALKEGATELGLLADAVDDKRVLEMLDQQVFWCDGCGWCCSTDELNNDGMEDLCDDCAEGDND